MAKTRKRGSLSIDVKRLLLQRRFDLGLPFLPPQQRGGGVISANGFRFKYTTYMDDTTYVFNGGNKYDCFMLFINPDHTAHLQGLRRGDNCSVEGGATSRNTLHAVLALAKEKGAKTLTLEDASNKYLPNKKYFSLSDMYFVTTGRTWYETYGGFRPTDEFVDQVARWRHIVATNTWESVLTSLHKSYSDVKIPVDVSDIDATTPGSAMIVLQRIKAANTEFFADYNLNLAQSSGIGTLEKIKWIADL